MTEVYKIGNRTYVFQSGHRSGKTLRLAALRSKAAEIPKSYLMQQVEKYQTDSAEVAAIPSPGFELLQRREAAFRHALGKPVEWPPDLDEETLRKVLLRGVESDGLRPYDWARFNRNMSRQSLPPPRCSRWSRISRPNYHRPLGSSYTPTTRAIRCSARGRSNRWCARSRRLPSKAGTGAKSPTTKRPKSTKRTRW